MRRRMDGDAHGPVAKKRGNLKLRHPSQVGTGDVMPRGDRAQRGKRKTASSIKRLRFVY